MTPHTGIGARLKKLEVLWQAKHPAARIVERFVDENDQEWTLTTDAAGRSTKAYAGFDPQREV